MQSFSSGTRDISKKIPTKTFLLFNYNKLHENGLVSHVRRLRYDIAHFYMGIANSSLACGPFLFLQQQAAAPSNIVAGVI